MNERERADHANQKYAQLKELVRELENRNADLEQKFAEVTALHICLVYGSSYQLLIYLDLLTFDYVNFVYMKESVNIFIIVFKYRGSLGIEVYTILVIQSKVSSSFLHSRSYFTV